MFSLIRKFQFRNIHSHLWFYSCRWREVLTSSAPGHMEQIKALVIKYPEVAEVSKGFLFREPRLRYTGTILRYILTFKVIGKVNKGCENHITARNMKVTSLLILSGLIAYCRCTSKGKCLQLGVFFRAVPLFLHNVKNTSSSVLSGF